MVEKLQIIFAKSFYYEGDYQLRRVGAEQVEIEFPELLLRLEAEQLTVQLMVERELYITFDELKALHIEPYEVESKKRLSGI